KKLQTKIVSGTTGRIVEKNIKINQFVATGDTLFGLDKTYISNQKNRPRNKQWYYYNAETGECWDILGSPKQSC
ncbi:MAG: biotin/lipoyl-binding protein, partial [Bacteroidota bacterium]